MDHDYTCCWLLPKRRRQRSQRLGFTLHRLVHDSLFFWIWPGPFYLLCGTDFGVCNGRDVDGRRSQSIDGRSDKSRRPTGTGATQQPHSAGFLRSIERGCGDLRISLGDWVRELEAAPIDGESTSNAVRLEELYYVFQAPSSQYVLVQWVHRLAALRAPRRFLGLRKTAQTSQTGHSTGGRTDISDQSNGRAAEPAYKSLGPSSILDQVRQWWKSGHTEAPLRPGHVRVRWTCRCGEDLFDDIVENRPGSAGEFQTLLRRYNAEKLGDPLTTQTSAISTPTSAGQAGGLQGAGLVSSSCSANSMNTRQTGGIVVSQQTTDCNDIDPRGTFTASNLPLRAQTTPVYLLACLNVGRNTTKTKHQPMYKDDIRSDRDLALCMRELWSLVNGKWYTANGLYRRLRFKGLASITFVPFYLHKNEVADVRHSPCVPPPPPPNHDYDFVRADHEPPIGPNQLLHLFQHHNEYATETLAFDRIPKKLSRLPDGDGLGVHLVEKVELWRVWLFVTVVFGIGSLTFAVTYGMLAKDLSTAFTVAAVLVAFPALAVPGITDYLG